MNIGIPALENNKAARTSERLLFTKNKLEKLNKLKSNNKN